MKVIYEPHPVTPERKKELRAQGYKIIDAKFKPEEAEEAPKPKRTRRKKVTGDASTKQIDS